MQLSSTNKKAIDFILPMGFGGFVFYHLYKRKGDYQESGIVALIVAAVSYVIISQITKGILTASINSLSSTVKNNLAIKYQLSTGDTATAQQRSTAIHTAFYGADGTAWTEDEAGAIAAVNQCQTPNEVKLLSDMYQTTYQKSLKGDFDKYVNFWDGSINSIVTANFF